jgi:hypothetical protein
MTRPLRASDADRELAVDILRVAAGEGRLTLAELDERLETALTARTIGELAALTADLPGGGVLLAAPYGDPDHGDPDHGDPDRSNPDHGDPDHGDPAVSRWALLQSLCPSVAPAASV